MVMIKTLSAVLALGAAVLAAPLEGRAMLPIGAFNVTNFRAYSVPHSSWSYVNFNVSVTTISPVTGCEVDVLSYQSVGSAPLTSCAEPTVAFNLTRNPDGSALFNVFWTFAAPGQMQGSIAIPAAQLAKSGLGTSVKEEYVGPRDFALTDVKLVHSVLGQ